MLGGSFSHNLTHVEEKDMGKNGLENQRHLKCYDALSRGGHLPQSLPICVVRIWREMGPFSIQNGARGVHPYGYVLGVIFQYGHNVSDSDKINPIHTPGICSHP